MTIQDILAALSGALNGLSQAILATTFGFAMMPSALAFVVGIIGCLAFQSTVPLCFQAETIAMAGSMGDNRQERLSMVLFAGLAMGVIGALGLLEDIVAFAGKDIIAAMMGGVGLILTKISFDIYKKEKKSAAISIATGLITYLLTKDLVYTFVACVVVTSVISWFLGIRLDPEDPIDDKFTLTKPSVSLKILRGSLALICITVGGNIAFSGVSASISGMEANVDHVSIYSGLADAASALFGGSPISVVIEPTAAAPHPVLSACLLMGFMIIILLTKSLPKLMRYIPFTAISGTLFVLGIIVTLPENLQVAYSDATPSSALACSATLALTAYTDPFFGLLAGIIIKTLAAPLGL